MPGKTKKLIQTRSKASGFNSVSAYIQFLVSQEDDLISEDELLRTVKQAQKEYEEGKAIDADSLRDFL
ncbi:hypothetical protein HN958_04845 [Candidatus Falkowbacteria bacterium]|nr:hypothetical protein [Candidatus Falkowbacteria bacterium]MBT7007798.1 hypothetical protein [Candidatus Falkowbacteria bacterium]